MNRSSYYVWALAFMWPCEGVLPGETFGGKLQGYLVPVAILPLVVGKVTSPHHVELIFMNNIVCRWLYIVCFDNFSFFFYSMGVIAKLKVSCTSSADILHKAY